MYECCNVKRFLKLIVLDVIIFGLCLILFFVGRFIVFAFSSESGSKQDVQTTNSSDEADHMEDECLSEIYTCIL